MVDDQQQYMLLSRQQKAFLSADTHPRLALFVHLHRTVPAFGSVLSTSRTIDPSAHRIWEPGFTSTGSFL